jgi:hypothetical protein
MDPRFVFTALAPVFLLVPYFCSHQCRQALFNGANCRATMSALRVRPKAVFTVLD